MIKFFQLIIRDSDRLMDKAQQFVDSGEKMKLSHIGILVKDIEQGIKNHESLFGYKQLGPIVDDPTQKVRVVLMGTSDADPIKIELISPLTEDSPVSDLLKKRQSLYHLCYEVNDIEAAKKMARENGAVIISQPVKAPLFDNRKICFLFTRDHYVVEFVEAE